ncbi:MAG: SdpI family protein [Oscillospiraceae bacterium]
MEFWLFMFLVDLIVPLIMLVMGKRFEAHPPKTINCWYGYRTTMSMKNENTWDFAHKHLGATWHSWGFIALPISAVALCLTISKDVQTVAIAGAAVCAAQVVLLIVSILPNEKALKAHFNEDGTAKPQPEQA